MIDLSKFKWDGGIVINGVEYTTTSQIPSNLDFSNGVSIHLTPKQEKSLKIENTNAEMDTNATKVDEPKNIGDGVYRIKVRQYMTRPATPEFDFMAKWNNNIPMPLRVMVGTKVKETRGMVYMILHGDIVSKLTPSCMKCGRPVTNPISQYFGLGPECGGHNYTNPFADVAELEEAVAEYRNNYLSKIVWEGWIVKSAIEELEEM